MGATTANAIAALGYAVGDTATGTTVTALGAVTCAAGYTQADASVAPSAACATAGGNFTFTGCEAKTVEQWCTDAKDTDADTDSDLDNFECGTDTYALTDAAETCTVAADTDGNTGTGTCAASTPATAYRTLSYLTG